MDDENVVAHFRKFPYADFYGDPVGFMTNNNGIRDSSIIQRCANRFLALMMIRRRYIEV